MMIRRRPFNLKLFVSAALIIAAFSGCQTEATKKHHRVSTIHLHLETNPNGTSLTETVPIEREHPFMINVEKEPFLTEARVAKAKLLDDHGVFEIWVQFDKEGTMLLEQYSASNREKRFAVYSQFFPPFEDKINEGRWLAAPKIHKRISDGVLVFTPDATREEAEQIVLGLNNIGLQLDSDSKKIW